MSINDTMLFNRRQLIATSILAGAAACVGAPTAADAQDQAPAVLTPPADGSPIPVAFLLDEGATIIDFCGPWEVFQDAGGANVPGFQLFTVSPQPEMFRATAGMQIVPHHTLENAPPAKVVVIPAQGSRRPENNQRKVDWLRERVADVDVVLSVCVGAFWLARTGALDGLSATTHHDFFDEFERNFPRVRLIRGRRFVENGKLVTAGGLTSGVDGALRVVDRYYGRAAATQTAEYMEYESRSWVIA